MIKPKRVRPFWVSVRTDGRQSRIGTGPMAHDGGQDIEVFQSVGGEAVNVADVLQRVDQHGNTVTLIEVARHVTVAPVRIEVIGPDGSAIPAPDYVAIRITAPR